MTAIIWVIFFTYVVISIMISARVTDLDNRVRNLEMVEQYRKNPVRQTFPTLPKTTHVDELV